MTFMEHWGWSREEDLGARGYERAEGEDRSEAPSSGHGKPCAILRKSVRMDCVVCVCVCVCVCVQVCM
jgi:hypothetical protein